MAIVQQLGAATARWPAAAVHDTVAAIVRQLPYRRSLRTSLIERFYRLLGDAFDSVMRAIAATPHGRWIAIASAALLVALVVARLSYAARLRDEALRTRRRTLRGAGVATELWADAERLAAEGRFTDAAHALYRALLDRLARTDRLRVHPSKTTGDYARELRASGSPAYAPFRQFGRRYDRVLFGHGVCDASSYAALRDDAISLLRRERAA